MITPFQAGPDRTLKLADGETDPISLDGYLLLVDDRYDEVLAAFNQPDFDQPCWLPSHFTEWKIADPKETPLDIFVRAPDGRGIPCEPAADCGPANFTLPTWLADNLDKLSTAALIDRRREETVAREAEKEAERKREQRAQRRRISQAARNATIKKQMQLIFEDQT